MSRPQVSEERLLDLLERASIQVEFPPTPPLAASVRARIESESSRTVPIPDRRRPRWLRPAFALAAVALAAAGSLALSVDARRAVADLLGVMGIEISFDDPEPGVEPKPRTTAAPDLTGLALGSPVTRSEAEAAVGFPVRGPSASSRAAELYLDPSVGDSGMISTLFVPRGESESALLITEFRASVDAAVAKKLAAPGGEIRVVELAAGDRAYWLSGDLHVFGYLDSAGNLREESIRLAGDVLLWDDSGVTYRIEGARSTARAIRLAARMGF